MGGKKDMYNYFKDTNLNEVYEYLLNNNMLDSFIKSVVLENEEYKKHKEKIKQLKNKSITNKEKSNK